MTIKILNTPDDKHPFLIINKPSGLPSAPLSNEDTNNALSQAIKLYPQIQSVHGRKNIEYGLLHRLDTVTEGLLLIALNQDFYDSILDLQNKGLFIKYYQAECDIKNVNKEGFPQFTKEIKLINDFQFDIESYFRSFGPGKKEVRPVTDLTAKYIQKKTNVSEVYKTNVKILNVYENSCTVLCNITKGFRHQVRCHLAWCGLPIVNDSTYNQASENQIKFKAVKLQFSYKNEDFDFSL